jgi:hypothetical protein
MSVPKVEFIDNLSACVDCLFAIANGDLPEDEEAKAAVIAGLDREWEAGWEWVYDCPEDCEGWFSWTPCSVCRRPLGGERHPVVLMQRRLPTQEYTR